MNLRRRDSEFSREEIEKALHFARKSEQRVWGTGYEHTIAHEKVERLEKLLEHKILSQKQSA